jgi:ABC-2 type transport system permease protein
MYFLIKYLIRKWREHKARRDDVAVDEEGDAGPHDSEPAAPDAARFSAAARRSGGAAERSAASRGPIGLLAHQVRYDLLASVRNPRARFFTFFFPILLLVVFNAAFGNGHTVIDGVHVRLKVFYVPGILTMSVVVAAYAGLVISMSALRETGVLKRRRSTPVPPALLIAGQALSTVVTTTLMAAVLLLLAKVAYGVGVGAGAMLAVACIVVIGTISFACIAYAVSGLIGSPEAAQPITQATMFPLWFISGVFIPIPNLPSALRHIGDVFPVSHLSNSLHLAVVHGTFSAAISLTDVLVLAAWALGAGAFAAWRFSWLPSTATV